MSSKKPIKDKKSVKEILQQRKKEHKKKLKEKRARLVIKNLPFDTTQENLTEYFSKYGDITDVQILKKEDGTLNGCAFVQYRLVQKARKAQCHTNGKPFQGRKLIVDFSMSKKEYQKQQFKKEVKEEPVEVKIEPQDEVSIKKENEQVEDVMKKSNTNEDSDEEMDVDSNKSESYESDSEEDDQNEERDEQEEEMKESRQRIISHDVSEGKTVFVKNVPFSATNEDLKACMEKYGPLYYALICFDKYTEHSKGTAFVKFCFKEDAEKVLQAGTELTLLGNVLDCHKALDRNEIQSQQEMKSNKKDSIKDSRNLYLVKEGVILAGSKAAEGVSQADMLKRLQLEKYKSQMLRNLNMFVSRERVVVHNLPLGWDDAKLRELCKKFAGEGGRIKEARVMRNMRDIDSNGLGKSKGFGFVTLNSHENALTLLRNLNNNPNVFSAAKRPIVTFSIERKTAVKAKLKRLERSKLKNPISKQYDPKLVEKEKKESEEKAKKQIKENPSTDGDLKDFAGIPGKPGVQRMRNNYKLKQQAAKHLETVKNEKKNKKNKKKTLTEKMQEFTKQEKQKINKTRESDNFSKLVSNYRKTISNVPNLKKKWYSEAD